MRRYPDTLGTRGFSRVRREFSVLAEGWHVFGRRPKPRAGHYKDLTETGSRARKVSAKNACFLIKCGPESLCPFSVLMEWRAVPFRVLSTREVNQLPELRPTKLSVNHFTGAPNVNLRKISVRKTIWDLEFSEHICCKISCLPASPSIFEHLKNGITAHFKRIFTLKRSPRTVREPFFWLKFSKR